MTSTARETHRSQFEQPQRSRTHEGPVLFGAPVGEDGLGGHREVSLELTFIISDGNDCVDESNMERAWQNVNANEGSPGSDGIILGEFPESFRHHWPEVRQQLLEGTYRPGPARLRAGVMVDGLLQPSAEGTMQGGPLSPLLANILLDDFDKELEARGLHFVRYANDFLVFVKSEVAA